MILVSRFAPYRINRLAIIIAAIITSNLVIGGGNTRTSYILFASVEVLGIIYIGRLALKWKFIN